jgi:uncharacterized repeat protein (TIGR03837 family)
MRWDLFCRVVDNFGDVGVCWRLAAELARRGEAVRLWADDRTALSWMAPHGAAGVEVRPWPSVAGGVPGAADADADADIVVEAFGCTLPDAYVARMAARALPPVWLNLEYLSAEPVVERLHALPSPQLAGAGRGLAKWFFYPGFSSATGGLIRESDLFVRRGTFDASGWRRAHGIEPRMGERCVSLFCYSNAALPALVRALSDRPTLLLAAHGTAAGVDGMIRGRGGEGDGVRTVELPPMSQSAYDELLWACDLNLVRGEDSFVRAQWAGQPFLWQAYPQSDAVHVAKLRAFLDRFLHSADAALASTLRAAFEAWNGVGGWSAGAIALPPMAPWRAHCARWTAALAGLPDLVDGLRDFARRSR